MATLQEIDRLRKDPRIRAFLDVIEKNEGGGDGVIYGGGTYDASYDEDHPANTGRIQPVPLPGGNYSTAVGPYQITQTTWNEFKHLAQGSRKFSRENQERVAIALMMRRGSIDPIMRGDTKQAAQKLRLEWEAFDRLLKGDTAIGTLDSLAADYESAMKGQMKGGIGRMATQARPDPNNIFPMKETGSVEFTPGDPTQTGGPGAGAGSGSSTSPEGSVSTDDRVSVQPPAEGEIERQASELYNEYIGRFQESNNLLRQRKAEIQKVYEPEELPTQKMSKLNMLGLMMMGTINPQAASEVIQRRQQNLLAQREAAKARNRARRDKLADMDTRLTIAQQDSLLKAHETMLEYGQNPKQVEQIARSQVAQRLQQPEISARIGAARQRFEKAVASGNQDRMEEAFTEYEAELSGIFGSLGLTDPVARLVAQEQLHTMLTEASGRFPIRGYGMPDDAGPDSGRRSRGGQAPRLGQGASREDVRDYFSQGGADDRSNRDIRLVPGGGIRGLPNIQGGGLVGDALTNPGAYVPGRMSRNLGVGGFEAIDIGLYGADAALRAQQIADQMPDVDTVDPFNTGESLESQEENQKRLDFLQMKRRVVAPGASSRRFGGSK